MTGKKFDDDKPMLATFYPDFANAYKGLIAVATHGAKKYDEDRNNPNWQNLENADERLKNSLFRHLDKYLTGEDIDIESGQSHLAHIIWNACILYELELRNARTARTTVAGL